MRGPDAPKPRLYGIWNIETMTINGVVEEIDARKVRMELQYYDRSNCRLVQSQLRWVQDFSFNR